MVNTRSLRGPGLVESQEEGVQKNENVELESVHTGKWQDLEAVTGATGFQ